MEGSDFSLFKDKIPELYCKNWENAREISIRI